MKDLQAKIAEYIGPERNINLNQLDCLSLNQRAVRMKELKLVTMDMMNTKSFLW